MTTMKICKAVGALLLLTSPSNAATDIIERLNQGNYARMRRTQRAALFEARSLTERLADNSSPVQRRRLLPKVQMWEMMWSRLARVIKAQSRDIYDALYDEEQSSGAYTDDAKLRDIFSKKANLLWLDEHVSAHLEKTSPKGKELWDQLWEIYADNKLTSKDKIEKIGKAYYEYKAKEDAERKKLIIDTYRLRNNAYQKLLNSKELSPGEHPELKELRDALLKDYLPGNDPESNGEEPRPLGRKAQNPKYRKKILEDTSRFIQEEITKWKFEQERQRKRLIQEQILLAQKRKLQLLKERRKQRLLQKEREQKRQQQLLHEQQQKQKLLQQQLEKQQLEKQRLKQEKLERERKQQEQLLERVGLDGDNIMSRTTRGRSQAVISRPNQRQPQRRWTAPSGRRRLAAFDARWHEEHLRRMSCKF